MTPPNSDIDNPVMTTGEVYRMAKSIREAVDEVKGDVKDVRDKLDEYPTMRDIANLENRLRDNENSVKWAMRGMMTALAGVVFNIIVETARVTT